jgi:hypothetical protein
VSRVAGIAGAAPAVVTYLAVVIALAAAITAKTGGTLVYPLDDTYVHMAIAKHTAVDGVWGVTSEHFTSASSSPLWTALLAVTYAIFGVSDAAPLALNVVIGIALLVSAYRLLIDAGMPAIAAVPWSLIVLFAGTVPTLTMIGMEHTLHALVTLWFIVLAARRVTDARPATSLPALIGCAALVAMTRYEGAFAVACVAIAFAVARRWRDAASIALAGALPIVAFGVWSISQGGFLLPNSVLLKGVMPPLTATGVAQLVLFWPAIKALIATPHLASLFAAVLVLALLPSDHARGRERRIAALLFAGCVLLHMQFARAGWFFRYESYLMVSGTVLAAILAQGVAWTKLVPSRGRMLAGAAGLVILALIALPIARRSFTAIRLVPGAASNIFEQHYQIAAFLDQHYAGRRIAVNDVGAIGYFADVKLLDVYGLASSEITSLKRRGDYTSQKVGELAARSGVEIAVIYPSWLAEYGGIPAGWEKAGAWGVADNLVLGESAASFFAVGGSRSELAHHLAAYARRLPPTVLQQVAGR